MNFNVFLKIFLFMSNLCVFTEENDVKISEKCYSWTSKAVFSKLTKNLSPPGILPWLPSKLVKMNVSWLRITLWGGFCISYFFVKLWPFVLLTSGKNIKIVCLKSTNDHKSSFWPNLRSIQAIFQEEINF